MHEGPVVVFSGGGTGGHLYPALALADALRAERPDVRVVFFGAERGIEARVLPALREEHHLLPIRGLDRSRPLDGWRAMVGLVRSVGRVGRLFRELEPEVVVVTGGYAGAPAGIAAGLSGVPLVLQEQNSVPGVVTKLLTRWAARVHVAYPEAIERLPNNRGAARVSGNPVRAASARGRDEMRAELDVPAAAALLLVMGGSQGSLALNRVLSEALEEYARGALQRPDSLHVLWITGPSHLDGVGALLERSGRPDWVRAVSYVDDLPSALVAADLAVSRSGAMSTAELLNAGLPAVLVPLPTSAEGHQMENARALEAMGAATLAPEASLTGAGLWAEVERLLAAPERLSEMRRAALALARPDAARDIASDIASMLSPRRVVE